MPPKPAGRGRGGTSGAQNNDLRSVANAMGGDQPPTSPPPQNGAGAGAAAAGNAQRWVSKRLQQQQPDAVGEQPQQHHTSGAAQPPARHTAQPASQPQQPVVHATTGPTGGPGGRGVPGGRGGHPGPSSPPPAEAPAALGASGSEHHQNLGMAMHPGAGRGRGGYNAPRHQGSGGFSREHTNQSFASSDAPGSGRGGGWSYGPPHPHPRGPAALSPAEIHHQQGGVPPQNFRQGGYNNTNTNVNRPEAGPDDNSASRNMTPPPHGAHYADPAGTAPSPPADRTSVKKRMAMVAPKRKTAPLSPATSPSGPTMPADHHHPDRAEEGGYDQSNNESPYQQSPMMLSAPAVHIPPPHPHGAHQDTTDSPHKAMRPMPASMHAVPSGPPQPSYRTARAQQHQPNPEASYPPPVGGGLLGRRPSEVPSPHLANSYHPQPDDAGPYGSDAVGSPDDPYAFAGSHIPPPPPPQHASQQAPPQQHQGNYGGYGQGGAMPPPRTNSGFSNNYQGYPPYDERQDSGYRASPNPAGAYSPDDMYSHFAQGSGYGNNAHQPPPPPTGGPPNQRFNNHPPSRGNSGFAPYDNNANQMPNQHYHQHPDAHGGGGDGAGGHQGHWQNAPQSGRDTPYGNNPPANASFNNPPRPGPQGPHGGAHPRRGSPLPAGGEAPNQGGDSAEQYPLNPPHPQQQQQQQGSLPPQAPAPTRTKQQRAPQPGAGTGPQQPVAPQNRTQPTVQQPVPSSLKPLVATAPTTAAAAPTLGGLTADALEALNNNPSGPNLVFSHLEEQAEIRRQQANTTSPLGGHAEKGTPKGSLLESSKDHHTAALHNTTNTAHAVHGTAPHRGATSSPMPVAPAATAPHNVPQSTLRPSVAGGPSTLPVPPQPQRQSPPLDPNQRQADPPAAAPEARTITKACKYTPLYSAKDEQVVEFAVANERTRETGESFEAATKTFPDMFPHTRGNIHRVRPAFEDKAEKFPEVLPVTTDTVGNIATFLEAVVPKVRAKIGVSHSSDNKETSSAAEPMRCYPQEPEFAMRNLWDTFDIPFGANVSFASTEISLSEHKKTWNVAYTPVLVALNLEFASDSPYLKSGRGLSDYQKQLSEMLQANPSASASVLSENLKTYLEACSATKDDVSESNSIAAGGDDDVAKAEGAEKKRRLSRSPSTHSTSSLTSMSAYSEVSVASEGLDGEGPSPILRRTKIIHAIASNALIQKQLDGIDALSRFEPLRNPPTANTKKSPPAKGKKGQQQQQELEQQEEALRDLKHQMTTNMIRSVATSSNNILWTTDDITEAHRLPLFEQIRLLAKHRYPALLDACNTDFTFNSWFAVLWVPIHEGQHQQHVSCGKMLTVYAVRPPRFLFRSSETVIDETVKPSEVKPLPFLEVVGSACSDAVASGNADEQSAVFRCDSHVLVFDFWAADAHTRLQRLIPHTQTTASAEAASRVGIVASVPIIGLIPVGLSPSGTAHSSTNTIGNMARPDVWFRPFRQSDGLQIYTAPLFLVATCAKILAHVQWLDKKDLISDRVRQVQRGSVLAVHKEEMERRAKNVAAWKLLFEAAGLKSTIADLSPLLDASSSYNTCGDVTLADDEVLLVYPNATPFLEIPSLQSLRVAGSPSTRLSAAATALASLEMKKEILRDGGATADELISRSSQQAPLASPTTIVSAETEAEDANLRSHAQQLEFFNLTPVGLPISPNMCDVLFKALSSGYAFFDFVGRKEQQRYLEMFITEHNRR